MRTNASDIHLRAYCLVARIQILFAQATHFDAFRSYANTNGIPKN